MFKKSLLSLCLAISMTTLARAEEVPPFDVRPGYTVTLAADKLEESRFIEFGAAGELYLSQPGPGKILTLLDKDGDGSFETRAEFLTDKPTVHGLHFYDGWLWWTQSGAVGRSRDTTGDGVADETEIIVADLVSGGGHWWRSILVTPEGFYTSIGDSGNINDETATDRQKIWKYTRDGKERTLFASGLRNTEKLRLRPGTTEVWGADHGSDWYGRPWGDKQGRQPITDSIPPEEFNHYVQDGFYGHPFVVGNKLPRIEFANRDDIIELAEKTVPPAWAGGAHWANNGFTFLSKDAFPDHAGDAIIAYHGSWNSRRRVGYCVQRILFDDVTGLPYGSLTLVSCLGGRDKQQVLARPCDVAEAPDGSILFTDSQGKRIFRISPSK
jgi:glucose/arabinose dehydrogenase